MTGPGEAYTSYIFRSGFIKRFIKITPDFGKATGIYIERFFFEVLQLPVLLVFSSNLKQLFFFIFFQFLLPGYSCPCN